MFQVLTKYGKDREAELGIRIEGRMKRKRNHLPTTRRFRKKKKETKTCKESANNVVLKICTLHRRGFV